MTLSSRHLPRPRSAPRSTPRSARSAAVVGTARVDRRLPLALRRARPGDVLVVDHLDLDRAGAQAVLERGVAAVVNASPFVSGRYPALGAEVLARAGVVLVEASGPEVLTAVRDGATVEVRDGGLWVRGEQVAAGSLVALDEVLGAMDRSRAGLATHLAAFTHNTTELLRREEDLLLHGRGFPDLATRMAGRPVVVVVRAFDHDRDLRRLRRFVREQRPVLVGVDGGADALLAHGLVPDLVVVGETGLGIDPDADRHQVVSDAGLTRAREVVLHADGSDRVVGAERLERLGVRARRMAAGGTSEDVALLLADHAGARLVVTVGTHATLDEFLDRQRAGMSSSFLTRLRLGPRLVDASVVPSLYAGGVRLWQVLLLLLVGLVAVAAAVATTPVGQDGVEALASALRDAGVLS